VDNGTIKLSHMYVSEYKTQPLLTTGTAFATQAESLKYGSIFLRRLVADAGIYGLPVAGSNVNGNQLALVGGLSTGTGTGGSILLATSPAGGSGSSVNTTTTKVTVGHSSTSITGGPLLFPTITTFADADATPTVAAGNWFKTANTGGTTITAFDDGATGQQICIEFGDANTTVTDGGTIKLQGAANFVSTADDSMCLQWRGTYWIEISRSVN
jgi:hypothetical protein